MKCEDCLLFINDKCYISGGPANYDDTACKLQKVSNHSSRVITSILKINYMIRVKLGKLFYKIGNKLQ